MEFEWDIFQRVATLQFCNKVQEYLSKMSEESNEFKGRIIFMSMSNDISWGSQDNEQEFKLSVNLGSIFARKFSPRRRSFLGSGSEKIWYSTHDSKLQGEWHRVAELMISVTSPLSRGTLKSKGDGNYSIHFCADGGTIETVFRTIVSVNL